MNPPFALKSSDEKEYKFVDRALLQMQDGGLLFAVLPYPAMVKPGQYKAWRENTLLRQHTLLCSITFPPDLFYPVGVHTLGLIIRKGSPHPQEQNVLWVRAISDGLMKNKGRRLPNQRAKNELFEIENDVKAFVNNPTWRVKSIDRLIKAAPIAFADPLLELVPENYLDEAQASHEDMERGIEQVMRNTMAFLLGEGVGK